MTAECFSASVTRGEKPMMICQAIYKGCEDELEVSLGRRAAGYFRETSGDFIYLSTPSGNRPCGVIIKGFLANWRAHREEAFIRVAAFLGVAPMDVREIIERRIAPFLPYYGSVDRLYQRELLAI
jgi:hypothetical protein